MKAWKKTAVALAVVTGLGIGATTAMARGGWWGNGPCGGPYGGPGMPPAAMNGGGQPGGYWGPGGRTAEDWAAARKAGIEQYLAWLQPTLMLSDNQTAAWNRFSTFVADHAEKNAARRQEMWNNAPPANAVERFELREKSIKAMEESVSEMKTEVTKFYNQLDDKQKQIFDANFTMGSGPGANMGPRQGPGPRGHRGGWHHGGGWGW